MFFYETRCEDGKRTMKELQRSGADNDEGVNQYVKRRGLTSGSIVTCSRQAHCTCESKQHELQNDPLTFSPANSSKAKSCCAI